MTTTTKKTAEHAVADALRKVAGALQKAIEDGYQSRQIDSDTLFETLMAVADELDEDADPVDVVEPPLDAEEQELADNFPVCDECGSKGHDNFTFADQNENLVRCEHCGCTKELWVTRC